MFRVISFSERFQVIYLSSMAVGVPVRGGGIYFITFTCFNWMPLIERTNSYNLVYSWFDRLRAQGHYIVSYVIMPNHIHVVIAFSNPAKTINTIISNGKRTLAYGIVNRLKLSRQNHLLAVMYHAVTPSDRVRGKIHKVFNRSFDCKKCVTERFILQKINYIHNNPCRGKWKLSEVPHEFKHCSARFYLTGERGLYPVTHYTELAGIALD